MIIINKWKKIFLDKDTYLKRKKRNLYKYFIFKTYNRNLKLSSIFINSIIKVYNGNKFIPIKINSLKLGLKCRYLLK